MKSNKPEVKKSSQQGDSSGKTIAARPARKQDMKNRNGRKGDLYKTLDKGEGRNREEENVIEEEEEDSKKRKTPRKVIKMGDTVRLHREEEWSWTESEEEWQGTVENEKKNKEKKKEMKRRRNERQGKTAVRAQHTAGIGPIYQETLDYFNRITVDYDSAKIMVTEEYMRECLKFNDEEMEEFRITDTQHSSKDNILYIVLDDPRSVKDIYIRMAELQDENLISRNYIPPQFFGRYAALGKYSKELRMKDELKNPNAIQ